jgi:hypothetical protein
LASKLANRKYYLSAKASGKLKESRRKNRTRFSKYVRNWRLKKEYGITQGQYISMYQEQEGRCSICSVYHEKLDIDHDHKTGKVRSLLCHSCNVALGFFGENLETIRSAIRYLEFHEHKH